MTWMYRGVQDERFFSPLVKFHVCIMKYAIGISQGRYLEQKMLEYKDLKKKKYKFDCLFVNRNYTSYTCIFDSNFRLGNKCKNCLHI